VALRGNALGKYVTMSTWDDDDDWVGEPPEGRYTRDRANPDFWRGMRPPINIGAIGIGIALIILLIAWLL
jgi:hypothetical protein